jgi:hypothetical protein
VPVLISLAAAEIGRVVDVGKGLAHGNRDVEKRARRLLPLFDIKDEESLVASGSAAHSLDHIPGRGSGQDGHVLEPDALQERPVLLSGPLLAAEVDQHQ